ncbi:MAG TPA: PQQ-binding-like beta-propeller repeat protein [Mycobacteriales bacterium]|nr:PQQ-binding-like beta-propeller repeat protein [Mycobacteriales bacterium]
MRRLAALTTIALAFTAACSGASVRSVVAPDINPHAAGTVGAKSVFTDWPSYHRTDGRAGTAVTAVHGQLHQAWTKHLDGAVYGEPLVVHGHLIVATENDSIYSLNPSNGHQLWRRHLGTPQNQAQLPCGDINPLGITGTPAYDAKTGSVFAVAETSGGHHTLWALNAATGHSRWHRSTDVLPSRNRSAEQERSALLVTDGRIITTYGGLAGDCDNYVGYVTSTATDGAGATTHYAVPTPREAGMWSPAGPVLGQNGNVYVASGNGAQESGTWDKSDSVTGLTPKTLHRVAVFAPATWRADNMQDLDLGSSSPVPVAGRIVIAGKRGTVYLLRQSLGGIGSAIATASGCQAYGGATHVGDIAVMPCAGGVRALVVGRHSLSWRWTASGIYGSPVVAGKRVYVADKSTGDLKVLSLATGNVVSSTPVGSLTHFPSEVVDGNHVFVPTLSGITAIRGS